MATRFELVVHGPDLTSLRAAGEEAVAEIERLEDQLSLYRPASEIAGLNARAASGPVRVSPTLFALLRHAQQLHRETGGAFDITIAPLVRCWGFMGGRGRRPTPEEEAEARANVGMDLVCLDPDTLAVRFSRPGVMLDLGAIGKGYAIERAAEVLREAGVTSALLHGGTSTVYALGHPPEADFWQVALEGPPTTLGSPLSPLPAVRLKDEAMSVSAIWGRSRGNCSVIFLTRAPAHRRKAQCWPRSCCPPPRKPTRSRPLCCSWVQVATATSPACVPGCALF